MARTKPEESFVPPPHANAGANAIVAERLKRMSPDAIRRSFVDAGICTSNGQLAERYRARGQK